MKNKKSPVGQYIIEGLGDTEEAHEYVADLLPLIGEVVLFFNGLESDLDHALCFQISDRSDQQGLLVLNKMMYATKVDLYERFNLDRFRGCEWDVGKVQELISLLRECGTLRNRIVHANWEYTDESGFTHVRFKFGKDGLEHELTQFSVESLEQVLYKILNARKSMGALSEYVEDKIMEFNIESAARQKKSAE